LKTAVLLNIFEETAIKKQNKKKTGLFDE